MFKRYANAFWQWYEKRSMLVIGVSAWLFPLQLLHLFWLTTDIVATRLLGYSLFHPTGLWELLIVVVDYLEVPTLLSVSLIYIHRLRKGWDGRSVLFLILLNSQWFHLFWITDEVVQQIFTRQGTTVLPFWAAWVAIFIDYLELPVILDTIRQFLHAVRAHQVKAFLQEEFASEKEP